MDDSKIMIITLSNILRIWDLKTKKCELDENINNCRIIMLPDQRSISQLEDLSFVVRDQTCTIAERIFVDCDNVDVAYENTRFLDRIILLPGNKIATIFEGPDVMIWK